jgi:hypothetical protein
MEIKDEYIIAIGSNVSDVNLAKVSNAFDIDWKGMLVRCKDCKHQHEYRTGSCPYYTTYGSEPQDNWFCADGVKKND